MLSGVSNVPYDSKYAEKEHRLNVLEIDLWNVVIVGFLIPVDLTIHHILV